MKRIKLVAIILGLIFLTSTAFAGLASAQGFKSGDNIVITSGETIDSMLFAAGRNIDIAGIINGDVYCAGQTITISGTVKGDVFCGGQNITISGTVDGNVRIGGQSVTISGTIGSSATIGAQNLNIDSKGLITRDLLGGSQTITINGKVGRDMVSGSQDLTINGIVGRNINGGVESISIGSNGNVGGNIDYYGTTDPTTSTGGKILGSVKRTDPPKQQAKMSPFAFSLGWFIYATLTMLVLSLFIIGLLPRIVIDSAAVAIKKPGKTFINGLLFMVLMPITVILLFITLIGAPIAITIILLSMIMMIVSLPLAGYVLGKKLFKNQTEPIWIASLGTLMLMILGFIPLIGCLILFIAHLFGFGMLLNQSKKLLGRTVSKK